MRTSSRMLGAALLGVAAAAMAMPALAQQDAPAGQAPPTNGPGTPQPGAPPPGSPPAAPAAPAQAAPDRTARSAVVIANVNLRSAPGTDAEILATIPAGSRVRVAEVHGDACWRRAREKECCQERSQYGGHNGQRRDRR